MQPAFGGDGIPAPQRLRNRRIHGTRVAGRWPRGVLFAAVIPATLCVSRASRLVGVTQIRGPHDVGRDRAALSTKRRRPSTWWRSSGNSEGRIRKPNHE
jgi:hypothetical protein